MLIQLVIIQIVTFVMLIFVLRTLFYRQLNSALARLRHLHEQNIKREEELRSEIEKINQEKDAELAKAKEEAAQIVKDAKEKASKLSQDIQNQAKDDARRIFEQSTTRIKDLEKDLAANYQEMALDLSVKMLELIFTEHGKENLQRQLIMELVEEIKNIEKERFTIKTKQVKVTSVSPIEPEQMKELVSILSDKIGTGIELQEETNPKLIAGLVIEIGTFIIDGSLRSKLRKVIPYLKTRSDQ
jgi:F-type H+-transporting ATPase subunit b